MRLLGPDADLLSGSPGLNCWISFAPASFQLYVLLSPYH